MVHGDLPRVQGSVTIFLDLDGPILDTRARNYAVHRALVEEQGRKVGLSPERFWTWKQAGRSSAQILARTGGGVDVEQFKRRWMVEIESPKWLRLDRLQPGVRETLGAWFPRWPLVLVTLRQDREALEAQLARLGLKRFFRAVLSETPVGRPGAETKQRLISGSPFHGRGVMIGDTEVDILAGRGLGLVTVGVWNGIRSRRRLAAEQPDVLVDGLAALKCVDFDAWARENAGRAGDANQAG